MDYIINTLDTQLSRRDLLAQRLIQQSENGMVTDSRRKERRAIPGCNFGAPLFMYFRVNSKLSSWLVSLSRKIADDPATHKTDRFRDAL
jgi:hypothetical protein